MTSSRATRPPRSSSALDLPVRILTAAPDAPVVFVDGVAADRTHVTLELSHWPGNRTPAALRHDLSTGCALRFAGLAAEQQRALAGAATAFANNHYDTDGTLALFALRHPEEALPRADRLLAAATAGDLFRWPDDDALALDAIVTGLSSDPSSPLARELEGLDDARRWQRCTDALLEELPALLDGDRERHRALWQPVLEAARADRDDLAGCTHDEDPTLDLACWTAPRAARSTRGGGPAFDPGRHALFGSTPRDRVLVLHESAAGTTCRLVVSTLSWFDLVTETRLPRPDLEALAARFNELEGTAPEDRQAWRAQGAANASPELWFGHAALPSFAEHNDALVPSALSAGTLRAEVERALRGSA